MRWEDERYVRLYTRDTGDWLALSFEAQSTWVLMLRRFDRAGYIDLGRGGRRALASILGHRERLEVIDAALTELLADGCVRLVGNRLFAPKFEAAQEWVATGAERQRKYRARKQSEQEASVTPGDVSDASDGRDEKVTPSLPSLPSLPSREEETLSTCVDGPAEVAPVESVEPGKATPPEQRVFAHWQHRLGHPKAKLDATRSRLVKARLAEGRTVEELCEAIDGCAKTPHNMGQNERGERYDDLVLICRDDAHVERFIANARAPPRPRTKANGRASEADKDWSNYNPETAEAF